MLTVKVIVFIVVDDDEHWPQGAESPG